MDGSGQLAQAFPRPGPALKALLIVIVALGIAGAVFVNWVPGGVGERVFLALACSTEDVLHGQVWRLVTAGLLTNPTSLSHLLFTAVGLYFLSPDLERRWGSARFARFVALSVVAGFALDIVMDLIAPRGVALFHPNRPLFGAGAAIAATAVAWSLANAHAQVRLFFVLPVSGRSLLWITIGFCALGLVYAGDVPEGVAAPFGGVLTGLLFAGEPSPARRLWLRIRLALLRRRARGVPTAHDIVNQGNRGAQPPKPLRRQGPPLRVVSGGLEDELKKRKPPKDKRYLN